ncbi:ABC transporter substrate-binding protein [Pseudomonas sp. ABC1]|uniref:ABC transporter substrate-binding protein n=1 Tax=Pseudomonas sp. ABC1 TaxID=2748080 RepID=UPI0015C31C90|nr:ABC transporter substrate-binding protein [Pseudomonas sp. ABC1]QLF91747.1 ABC transporter substrate-binding protein [Pseudomonas sp. ABC1]
MFLRFRRGPQRLRGQARAYGAGVVLSLLVVQGAMALPRVVSTNLCADYLALGLAAPGQLLSVSAKSQDARVSSMPGQARQYPANQATSEEIIALRPDLVLASRRWLAQNPRELFQRHGIEVLAVPYPTTWQQIFDTTLLVARRMDREAAGQAHVADWQARLQRLQARERPFRLLYLRPNGGSAGYETYVDTVFQALGAENAFPARGWGHYPLERLLGAPPDVLVKADMLIDQGHAKSSYWRHPRLQQLLRHTPSITIADNRWGCSDGQLVTAAEQLAGQLDALVDTGVLHP